MNTKYDIGAPIFLPERPSDLPRLLSRTFQALEPDILRALTRFVEQPSLLGLELLQGCVPTMAGEDRVPRAVLRDDEGLEETVLADAGDEVGEIGLPFSPFVRAFLTCRWRDDRGMGLVRIGCLRGGQMEGAAQRCDPLHDDAWEKAKR